MIEDAIAEARATPPALDDMEGALHYALGHMSDECECDRIWSDIRKFHAMSVEPLPEYARLSAPRGVPRP
jgi:hypothetical protein